MDPDQAASEGAVWSRLILFEIYATQVHKQIREVAIIVIHCGHIPLLPFDTGFI